MNKKEFFVKEEHLDLVFEGGKFRVKGISLDQFIEALRKFLQHGLVSAPFKITTENISKLKPSLVFPLATSIINLSARKMRDFSLKPTENPLAA